MAHSWLAPHVLRLPTCLGALPCTWKPPRPLSAARPEDLRISMRESSFKSSKQKPLFSAGIPTTILTGIIDEDKVLKISFINGWLLDRRKCGSEKILSVNLIWIGHSQNWLSESRQKNYLILQKLDYHDIYQNMDIIFFEYFCSKFLWAIIDVSRAEAKFWTSRKIKS